MKPWGDIIQFGRTLDEDDFYVTPKLLIETAQLGNIEATKQVVLLGKRWQLQITETFGVGSELQQLTDKVPAQENDINDPFITTGQGEADFPPPYPSVVENVVVEESHNSDRVSECPEVCVDSELSIQQPQEPTRLWYLKPPQKIFRLHLIRALIKSLLYRTSTLLTGNRGIEIHPHLSLTAKAMMVSQ